VGGDKEEGEENNPYLFTPPLPCGVTEHTPQGKPSPVRGLRLRRASGSERGGK